MVTFPERVKPRDQRQRRSTFWARTASALGTHLFKELIAGRYRPRPKFNCGRVFVLLDSSRRCLINDFYHLNCRGKAFASDCSQLVRLIQVWSKDFFGLRKESFSDFGLQIWSTKTQSSWDLRQISLELEPAYRNHLLNQIAGSNVDLSDFCLATLTAKLYYI